VSVKADEVRAEQAREHRLPVREHAEDLGGREGDVQEEPDARVRQALAEHRGQEHELVVVHPDELVSASVLAHDVRKILVRRLVLGEVVDDVRQSIEQVVEEGPDDPVANAIVEAFARAPRQVDGDEVKGGEAFVHERALLRREVAQTWPTYPCPVPALVEPAQPRRKSATTRRDLGASRRTADGNRQTVGNQNHSIGHACSAGIDRRSVQQGGKLHGNVRLSLLSLLDKLDKSGVALGIPTSSSE
jgi:hypothetical protein